MDSHILRMSRGKRSFWKFWFSLFAKISWERLVLEAYRFSFLTKVWWKLLVLEVWIPIFCESLVENARLEVWSKEFVFSFSFAVFGALALPLVCWKVSAREFTFQLVAVTSGTGKRRGKSKEFVFSLWFVVLYRGVCTTTCLLEGEGARIYVPILLLWHWDLPFQFSFFCVTRCATGRLPQRLRDSLLGSLC